MPRASQPLSFHLATPEAKAYAGEMHPDISAHEEWFRTYAAAQRAREHDDPGPLDLKLEHTFAVLENARAIVREEDFPPSLARASLLAALYHDVARFEQYLRWRTFRDALSCNHGLLGVRIVRCEKRLAQESREVRAIALAAIGLHNRFALPARLAATVETAARLVRDADKLDILRVMRAHLAQPGPYNPTIVLNLPDDPRAVSGKVLNDVLAGRVPSYSDLKSVNDFRVLLGAWFFDMHFPASRRRYLEAGHGRSLVEGLGKDGPYAEARARLLAQMDQP